MFHLNVFLERIVVDIALRALFDVHIRHDVLAKLHGEAPLPLFAVSLRPTLRDEITA